MKDNEEIVAIPYNDHAIFVEEYGLLSERVGIAWKKDKDIPDRLDNPYYIGDDDYWHIPAGATDDFDDNPVIAHRGETIPFENLCHVFGYTRYISSLIPDIENYDVHIDKSNMTGSLKVFINHCFYNDGDSEDKCWYCELTVETDKKVVVMSLNETLHSSASGLEDEEEEILEKLRDRLVPFLIEYRKLFRSKVEIGVFFRKSTSLKADDRKKENRIIYDKEKKYLGTIRRFVKEEFEKEWNEFLDKEYQEEAYKSKSYEWQQEAASKYDMYPNLTE